MIPLPDFGELQTRYQSLPLASRAGAILKDAEPAMEAAQNILTQLADHADCKKLFEALRKNHNLTGKMRASEAKNMLLDASTDFITGTRHKIAAWRKTVERIGQGESIMNTGGKEFIPNHAPLALAIIGSSSVSSYLAIIQLALAELAKTDSNYASKTAEIRRCATILSDCEVASGFAASVH